MTSYDEDHGAGIGDALRRAIGDEPPLTLRAVSIARQGARRLRRRRATTVGGAMLAVATLTAGVTLGVPRLTSSISAASSSSVPGCTTVLRTDDPAVTAWQNGYSAVPTPPPTSINTGAESSSSAATTPEAQAGTEPGVVDGKTVPKWLTVAKAARMAAAFSAAIPNGVLLSAADSSAQAGPLPFTAGSGMAGGSVVVSAGADRAFLTIDVQMWDKGAPPCTANLAHRYTSADGSITDVIDDPGNSQTGHYMLAESFRPDGTLVNVGLNVALQN